MEARLTALKSLLSDVVRFVEHTSYLRLRRYQVEAAQCIVNSVINKQGLTFVVIFPRQSGKNELQAQIETYLLALYSKTDAEIVKVSPTWKPQSLNAMRRLERILKRNLMTCALEWTKESGYIFRVGSARIFFLSGSPAANVVGATASTLLECDEAQDVLPSKWDKDIAPMAASTNATRVFWGTAWTSRTLLAREKRAAQEAEKEDGIRRVFILNADDVSREVPAYGQFVAGQVARLGRNHPMVMTQFYSEEIDAEGGMFSPRRRALMQGGHPRREAPTPGSIYALLLDVAGEDEGAIGDGSSGKWASTQGCPNTKRDSTALTIVEIDLGTLADDLIQAPSYRVVNRYAWIGTQHTSLYGQILALADHWEARYLVVDATGVGAGLASFLDKALPGRVVQFVFSSKSKSDLGWGFLACIETGRFKEYQVSSEEVSCVRRHVPGKNVTRDTRELDTLQAEFWQQIDHCISQVLDGPGHLMRWGVPDGTRDPETGELVHDDLVLSAALCAELDKQVWGLAESAVIEARDPMKDLEF